MSSRSDRFEYGIAKPEDAGQLLKIFESVTYQGGISVLYTRRPDPYKSLQLEADHALILKASDQATGMICALGGCLIRKAYINGAICNTAYLTGLKILPEYRKRMPRIADVYKFLNEQTKHEVDLYYTTILKDNLEAQRMLTRSHKNMPEYRYHGNYTVYSFGTGRGYRAAGFSFEKGNSKELLEFYTAQSPQYNLAPVDSNLGGAGEQEFYTLRYKDGPILAAAMVWNQQSYKQYILKGYQGIFKLVQHLPLKSLGYPAFPKENTAANYASITMFYVKDNDLKIAEIFLKKILECCWRYDFLSLGLFQGHPLEAMVEKIKHIKYQSNFYTVHWDQNVLLLDKRPLNLEVGLL